MVIVLVQDIFLLEFIKYVRIVSEDIFLHRLKCTKPQSPVKIIGSSGKYEFVQSSKMYCSGRLHNHLNELMLCQSRKHNLKSLTQL